MNQRNYRSCLGGMFALLLSACVPHDGKTDNTSPPPDNSTQEQNFAGRGFRSQDVLTMAAYLAADLPNSPLLRTEGGVARVIVSERAIRLLDTQVVLDKRAFSHQLLQALQKNANAQIRYVGHFSNGKEARSSRTSAISLGGNAETGRSGGFGRSNGGRNHSQAATAVSSGATYALLITVSRQSGEENGKPPAQNYDMQVVGIPGETPVWQGSYLLDAPEANKP
ncbi:TPA: hypothetical protein ACOVJB_002478 [Klebsiella oxytoca]